MTGPLIALTGATGFIGRHLLQELPRRGYRLRVLLRRPSEVPPGASSAVIGDIAAPQNMAAALRGVDAVIHSAGLAHAMSGRPEDDYRAINTEATIGLARAAERAGARRFVFLSSIRAQSGPSADRTLTEEDAPVPVALRDGCHSPRLALRSAPEKDATSSPSWTTLPERKTSL